MVLLTYMARGGPAVAGFRVLDSVDAAKEYAKRKFGGRLCAIWEVSPDKEPVLRAKQKYGKQQRLEWVDK